MIGKRPTVVKVLVVEDEALVALQIENFLSRAGHSVVGIADSISTALEVVEADVPDMALVDVNLVGGESGIALAEKLREHQIPVLLATGNCPPELASQVAVGCLSKPFASCELLSAVTIIAQLKTGMVTEPPPPSLRLF